MTDPAVIKQADHPKLFGMSVIEKPNLPSGTVRFVSKDGKVLGEIRPSLLPKP